MQEISLIKLKPTKRTITKIEMQEVLLDIKFMKYFARN